MDKVVDICWKNPHKPATGIRIPDEIGLEDRLFLWKVKMICGKEYGWPGNGPYHRTWWECEALSEVLRDQLTGLIPPDEYPRLLDVGCAGREAIMLKEKGYDVVGVDCNPADIEWTRSNGVEAYRMDMHDLRFPNESFDAGLTHHTFEHGHIPWLQILELWAVLKPNAPLIFVVPPFNGERSRINEPQGLHESHSMCLHENQWLAIFERLGFELVARNLVGEPQVSGHMGLLLRRQPYTETIENCRFFLEERIKIGEYYQWPVYKDDGWIRSG